MSNNTEDILFRTLRNSELCEYKGFDPYDALHGNISYSHLGKWGSVIFTQLNKHSPVNFRHFFGIKRDVNPKALGLMLISYCKLYRIYQNDSYLLKANSLFNELLDLRLKEQENYCWGYNFNWYASDGLVLSNTPNIVSTATVAKGIFEYYKITKDEKVKNVLLAIKDHIINDLPRHENSTGIIFSYSPAYFSACYNASLLATEVLADCNSLQFFDPTQDLIVKALSFVKQKQKENGEWAYSINIKTNKEYFQTDFHQGYILNSIHNITCGTALAKEYAPVLKKGFEFYITNQFEPNGRSKWRLPKKYPTDIHCQAQGILTSIIMNNSVSGFPAFDKTILDWTIANMYDQDKGYFYFRKHSLFTNKIDYFRWSQAWMILAMVCHIENNSLKRT